MGAGRGGPGVLAALLAILLASRAADAARAVGTTSLVDLGRADVSFTLELSAGELGALYSTEEDKLRGYVCRSLFARYPLAFCFVSFSEGRLYAHLFIDDVSHFMVVRDLSPHGEAALQVSYAPLALELFPNLAISWEENVLLPPGQRFRKSGVSGQRVALSVGVFADAGSIAFSPSLAPQAAPQRSAVRLDLGVAANTTLAPSVCIAYVRRGGTIYHTLVSPACEPALLPVGAWPVGHDYTVDAYAMRLGETLHMARAILPLAVAAPPVQFLTLQLPSLRPSRIVYRGETVTARISTPKLDASCTISLRSARGRDVLSKQVSCDTELGVDTAQLAPGSYEFVAEGTSGGERNALSAAFQLVASKVREVEGNLTSKAEYLAGETIALSLAHLAGASCYATLLDAVGSQLAAHHEPQPCAGFFLEVPSSARPGDYTLRVQVSQGGRTVATRSQVVAVHELEPENRLSGICRSGRFEAAPRANMPCLAVGMRCRPGPADLPACLCATELDVFVCKMEALCTAQGCQGGREVGLDLSEGSCTIRAGLVSYACAFDGETCTKRSCSCLDPSAHTLDTCAFGQLCTPIGCAEPTLTAEVESFGPAVFRREDLASGSALELVAKLRYRGVELSELRADDLSGQLAVASERFPPVKPARYLGSGRWLFRFPLQVNPEPGPYRLFVKLFYHQEAWSVARSIEVWHPRKEALLDGRVVAAPTSLEHGDLRFGVRKLILLRLSDRGDLVTSLPAGAFRAFLGGEEMIVNSAEFDDVRSLWSLLVIFRSPRPEALGPSAPLWVNVSHLGQGANLTCADVLLAEVAPTSIDIVAVEPRDSVFQAESVLGFDFALTLALRGFSNEDLSNLFVNVTNDHGEGVQSVEVPYELMDLVTTPQGIQVFVRGVRFCDPVVFIPKLVTVTIGVLGKPSAAATTHLFVRANPGGWLFDSCALGPQEATYGNIILEETRLDRIAVSVRNTGSSPWPAGSQLVLVVGKGFSERPLIVRRTALGAVGPGDVRHVPCPSDPPLLPGEYAVAAYIEAPGEPARVLSSKSVVVAIA